MKAFDYQPVFKKTILDNGIRVVTEHHPNTRATSAGIFVDLGTRDEPGDLIGGSHFIEHLVFKGTKSRTAFDLVKALEEVGGDINAYTTRDTTCFHAVTLREHLDISLDILTDLVTNASPPPGEFEKELDVVLQEIDMSKDTLEEYIFDVYFEECYRAHNLGRPILGTEGSLKSFKQEQVLDFYRSRYRGKNLVVAIAGDVDHDEVVKKIKDLLPQDQAVETPKRTKPKELGFRKFLKKPSEQMHLLIGMPSSAFRERHRFEGFMAHSYLGGGMTSKLYQEVREKHGLAYSIYSYLHSFTDSGICMIYAGTNEENLPKTAELIVDAIKDVKENGIPQKDLDMLKAQVEGSIVLAADDIENRMSSIAVNEMIFNEYKPVEGLLEDIDKVTVESIQEFADAYFDMDRLGALLIGNMEEDKANKLLNNLL